MPITTIVYKFTADIDRILFPRPYPARICKRSVTLGDVKAKCPAAKTPFRYFFRNGMVGWLQEETDDDKVVPLSGIQVVVECRRTFHDTML
jgi:hypothetical protein